MKNKHLFIRICFLFILIFLGSLIFYKLFINKPVCKQCNVILISLDTLGANHLPCYGYERNTAQNLCNFAKDNVFFTNVFSNASWTLPSHFSIFTSLYPNHHNIVTYGQNKLDSSITMMAEFFKKSDYKTIYVGPTDDYTLPLNRGIERGFNTIIPLNNKTLTSWDEGISQLLKNNSQKQNTFLFLHTYWVHDPYLINNIPEAKNKRIYTNDFYQDIALDEASYRKFSQEFKDYVITRYENNIKEGKFFDKKNDQNVINGLKRAKNIIDAEEIYNNLVTDNKIRYENISTFNIYQLTKSDERRAYAKSLYDEMIYYLDKNLATIFNLASNKELANNTIIVITSDHGEEFMEHGALTHPADHLYNTTTSVLLTMYIPGIKQRKINNFVQSIDILPTVLNLIGIKNSGNNFDGIDLTDSILGYRQAKRNDYLISEGPNIDSIRDNRWKLYVKDAFNENITYELYDLQNDPLEKNNLAQKESKVVKNLRENLYRIIYKK